MVPILASTSLHATYHKRQTTGMEQLEHIGHHSISPALIAALILLVLLIVLPNIFLAPTNPKDKAD